MADDAEAEAHVSLRDVDVVFGDRDVFQGLDCDFARGGITVLMGGSGSGKSTLLRVIAGLQPTQAGSVRVAGREVAELTERELYDVRQRIGMMFQGGALLDTLTVFENVALPLREHTPLSQDEIGDEVHRRLDAVGLAKDEGMLPSQISGGMVRRAALARAIVRNPEIVLCDEPFAGLDPLNVRRIEALLTHLNRSQGLTLIVASHHISSALRMADRIVFLLDGHAVSGTPRELAASAESRISDFFAAEIETTPEEAGETVQPVTHQVWSGEENV